MVRGEGCSGEFCEGPVGGVLFESLIWSRGRLTGVLSVSVTAAASCVCVHVKYQGAHMYIHNYIQLSYVHVNGLAMLYKIFRHPPYGHVINCAIGARVYTI